MEKKITKKTRSKTKVEFVAFKLNGMERAGMITILKQSNFDIKVVKELFMFYIMLEPTKKELDDEKIEIAEDGKYTLTSENLLKEFQLSLPATIAITSRLKEISKSAPMDNAVISAVEKFIK